MSKGGIIIGTLTGIVLGVAIAIASVLIFFYVFKVHVEIQIREQYVWNKVQEMPLDLLSMDIEGEPFVSRMNKVYYEFIDKDSFKTEVNDKTLRQIFYHFETPEYPFEYFITIGNMTLTGSKDCSCDGPWYAYLTGDFECNIHCGGSIPGRPCGRFLSLNAPFWYPDNSLCFGKTKKVYRGMYPFPLTFDGTANFTNVISYEVIQIIEGG